jgi:hypothetical protein
MKLKGSSEEIKKKIKRSRFDNKKEVAMIYMEVKNKEKR